MQLSSIKFEAIGLDRYDEVIQLIAQTYFQNNQYYANGLFPIDQLVETTRFIRQLYESADNKYPNRPLILALTQNSKIIASTFILDFSCYHQRVIRSRSPWQRIYLALDPKDHPAGTSNILFRLAVAKDRVRQGLAGLLFQNVVRYLSEIGVQYVIAVQSSVGAQKTFARYNPNIVKKIVMAHKGQNLQSELIVIDNKLMGSIYPESKL